MGAVICGPVVEVVDDANGEDADACGVGAGLKHILQALHTLQCGGAPNGRAGLVFAELVDEVAGVFRDIVGVEAVLDEAAEGGLDDVLGFEGVLGRTDGVENGRG